MSEEDEENIEYNEFVRMPPVKTQIVRMKIKSIKKAEMRIVELK